MKNNTISLSRAIFMFILVALFLVYEMAVQVSPAIITNELMTAFRINAVGLGLISGCYFYTYTLMQIPAGLLYDRFNVRYVIVLPLIICSIGLFLFAQAHSVATASFARLFMGVGSAFAFIGVLVVAKDVFPHRHFALLAGLTQMLAAFGAMGGELPLLALVQHFTWRPTLAGISLSGLVLAILIACYVRYPKPCSLEDYGNSLGSLFHSLAAIIKQTQTWWIALYACLMWAPMSAFASLWGIPYLSKQFALSAASAAGLMSFMWLGLALASPLVGWWSDYIGARKTPLIICALTGSIAFIAIMFCAYLPQWILGILVLLAGVACAGQALSFANVRENNAPQHQAAAIGFNNLAVVISGAIFQPLVAKLIEWHSQNILVNGLPQYQANDYQFGLQVVAAAYVIAVFVAIFKIRESYVV